MYLETYSNSVFCEKKIVANKNDSLKLCSVFYRQACVCFEYKNYTFLAKRMSDMTICACYIAQFKRTCRLWFIIQMRPFKPNPVVVGDTLFEVALLRFGGTLDANVRNFASLQS